MELLPAGVDSSAIALSLGQESIGTKQTYQHGYISLNEAVLVNLKPYQRGKPTRFRPSDHLLAFLEPPQSKRLCRTERELCALITVATARAQRIALKTAPSSAMHCINSQTKWPRSRSLPVPRLRSYR